MAHLGAGTNGHTAALQQAIDLARRELLTQVDGHLPRPVRLDVYAALGPVGTCAPTPSPPTYQQLLASAAIIERALSVWRAERPDDDRPARLLKAALASPAAAADAREAAEAFNEAVMELYDPPAISDEAGAAGHAVFELVGEAVFGMDRGYWPESDDHELDSFSWDSVYFAEIALTTDDPAKNREARHALWTWWLDEAVPAAAAGRRA